MIRDINDARSLLAHPHVKKLTLAACAAFFAVSLLPQRAFAEVSFRLQPSAARPVTADRSKWKPVFVALPARGLTSQMLSRAGTAAVVTLPNVTGRITSPLDHHSYSVTILGPNPLAKVKTSLTIPYVPIALRIHFDDGTVLDPTKPGCNDNVSVANRFSASPVFQNVTNISNGVNVGTTQVIDAFQRAQLWNIVKGSNYHVLLASAAPLRVIDVTAPGFYTSPGACAGSNHNLGIVDAGSYDTILQQIANQFVTPSQLPIIFAYNVVLSDSSGGCCILGYHSAYNRGTNIQVYGTGAYLDSNIFANTDDIATWTHELGELFNDPFVNNATPAWGHTGQVSGCQNNFEVGDPLSGVEYTLAANGFTYHAQDLAFFDWFYRFASKATGGKFSYHGTFTAPQGACH